jgi:hypothetical protein
MWGSAVLKRNAIVFRADTPRETVTKRPLDIGGQPRRSKKKEEKRRERAWRVSVFFISVFCSS